MEIFILMSITGLIGLSVSAAILFLAHSEKLKGFDSQEHKDLFRRLKLNANRIK